MKKIDKYKDVLFDILAKRVGIGAVDNKIYDCRELYCDECKLDPDCNGGPCRLPFSDLILKTHQWLDRNFELQNEDIMDYLCDTLAIRIPENEFTCCDEMPACALCFFNHYKEEESCTKGKRIWLNEEV